MGNIKEIESMILKSDQLGAFVQGDLGYIKYTVGDIYNPQNEMFLKN